MDKGHALWAGLLLALGLSTALEALSFEGRQQGNPFALDVRTLENRQQGNPFALDVRTFENRRQGNPFALDTHTFENRRQSNPFALDTHTFENRRQSHPFALDVRTFESRRQSSPFALDTLPSDNQPCDESAPGLNFCGASGGGSFEQQILKDDIINVPGIIPEGIGILRIVLRSDEDVDIQLYDLIDGTAIVKWPDGLLNDPGRESLEYQGSTIEYSGYQGDGTGLGHEFIALSGTTTRRLQMKAFGYQAGFATVEYQWERKISGTFEQQILLSDIVDVPGELAEGITDISIALRSDVDVDVQLYDKIDGTAIVKWPNGLLNGPRPQSLEYQGMTIDYSGYYGDGSGRGHEFVRITGKTTRPLLMKAFGYRAGFATVNFENLSAVQPAVKWAGGDGEERPLPGSALPLSYGLEANVPNPFNPSTQITYQLPEAGPVKLAIYNMLGQPIRILVATDKQPGFYQVEWDGTDNNRQPVASGVYLYRLTSGPFTQTNRMLLLK